MTTKTDLQAKVNILRNNKENLQATCGVLRENIKCLEIELDDARNLIEELKEKQKPVQPSRRHRRPS